VGSQHILDMRDSLLHGFDLATLTENQCYESIDEAFSNALGIR
jgi:hypothetical protein